MILRRGMLSSFIEPIVLGSTVEIVHKMPFLRGILMRNLVN